MALYHSKTNTIADWTGTVTVGNSTGGTQTANATDLVRPGDWNSAHLQQLTLTGNTSGQSTVSGTNILFAGGPNIFLSASQGTDPQATVSLLYNATVTLGGSTANQSTVSGTRIDFRATNGLSVLGSVGAPGSGRIEFGMNVMSGFAPYFPGSTGTMTQGAMGTSTASVFVMPIVLPVPVQLEFLRLVQSNSLVTSTVSGQQTITSQWGLFYETTGAGQLNLFSSGSFSLALTVSSVSGTISAPLTSDISGYAYGTTTWTGNAQGQSLVGSAFPRLVDLDFGAQKTLSHGQWFLGLFQRQSSSSANVGLSTARYGNVVATQLTAMQAIGVSTVGTTQFESRMRGLGMFTVTQTALPTFITMSQMNHSVTQIPLVSLTQVFT